MHGPELPVTVDLQGHLLRDAKRQATDAVATLLASAPAHKPSKDKQELPQSRGSSCLY